MTAVRLAALFWRRGGSRQRSTLALTAAGVLASTVLALLSISVSPAISTRADHVAWRTPIPLRDDAAASLLIRAGTDSYEGRSIARIDLETVAGAGAGAGDRPAVLPGLARLPEPGEVVASPAMAELLRRTPTDVLGDRDPGRLVGTLGPGALAHDRELVVVVGRAPGSLRVDGASPATPVVRLASDQGDLAGVGAPDLDQGLGLGDDLDVYRSLAQMAAVLLVVPTLLLVGAAARLTAAQREQRLAALRLAGATPATVVGLTTLEVGGAALVGAIGGVAAYLAVLPLAARIPLAGAPFPVADLRLGEMALAVAVVLVPVLAALAAVAALRTVVVGPLGASRRVRSRRPRLVRFAVVPVAWILFVHGVTSMRDGGDVGGALLGLAAVIATLAVLGPWGAWAIGALLGLLARGPASLIAARRITDDPRATYRAISGLVLAGLIAGFLFGVLPTIRAVSVPDRSSPTLVTVDAADWPAVEAAVLAAEPRAVVWDGSGWPEAGFLDDDGRGPDRATEGSRATGGVIDGAIAVLDPGDLERVRTAVLRAVPDAVLRGDDADLAAADLLLDDLGRASTILALASLAMATAATAIGSVAAILDQRVTLARLRLAGTPVAVLQRARRWQVLVPLILASLGAMVTGAVAGLGMLVAFGTTSEQVRPPDLTSMAVLGVAAVAAGLGVVAATRPVLDAVSRLAPRD